MPAVHTPLEKARITGAIKTNPERFKNRADPKLDHVGDPPHWMSRAEKRAWALICDEIPWLTRADRMLVEVAARLRARMMSDEFVTVPTLNLLRQVCAQLGATPADRAKITVPNEPPADPQESHFH
jgi:hypothetical protein